MSFLAAVLLLNMDPSDAFICFANLLNKPCQLAFFRVDHPMVMSLLHWVRCYFNYNVSDGTFKVSFNKLSLSLCLSLCLLFHPLITMKICSQPAWAVTDINPSFCFPICNLIFLACSVDDCILRCLRNLSRRVCPQTSHAFYRRELHTWYVSHWLVRLRWAQLNKALHSITTNVRV